MRCSPGADAGSSAASAYRTCLDRPFVQKEVDWSQEHQKLVITVFEDERRRQAHFCYTKAWAKYGGSKWEFILVSSLPLLCPLACGSPAEVVALRRTSTR